MDVVLSITVDKDCHTVDPPGPVCRPAGEHGPVMPLLDRLYRTFDSAGYRGDRFAVR